MRFGSKSKNRRLEREHVLDVKLRSSQVRATRMRRFAIGLGVLFATVFGLYLLWRIGEWGLDHLVYQNSAFAIQDIDVQTDGVIAVDQLRRWAGVRGDENLMALDLGRVKRNLEMVPLVQSVSVERILPRTLRIRVLEREPLAQIMLPASRRSGGFETVGFLLDADGFVMLPLGPNQRAAPANQQGDQLPVICGLNANEVQTGRRLEAIQVQAALRLVAALERSPMAGLAELKLIDVSTAEILVVTTGQGSVITFGLTDLEQQLRRWREIFDQGQKGSKAISSLDLAVSNNIPARWLEASAVPPVTPKVLKPFHAKKKHV